MIRTSFGSRLLVSIVISLALATAAYAAPPNSDQMREGGQELLKSAMLEAFKKSLGPGGELIGDASDLVIDPLVSASTTPGSAAEKAEAWLKAMGQAGVNAAWPAYGLAISGGKIVVGGAQYTVEEMINALHAQQDEAILFGPVAKGLDRVGNIAADTPFINLPKLVAQHINRDNMGVRIRSEQELHDYWFNDYRVWIAPFHLQETNVIIQRDWPLLLKAWRLQRAAIVEREFFARLDAAEAKAIRDTEAKQAGAQQDGASALPDISGTWHFVDDWEYEIKQTGSNFTWWMKKFQSNGKGTVDGRALSVSWDGTDGSGSATGTVTVDASGRATRIDWSNGVVFKR